MNRYSRTINCAFAGLGLGGLVLATPATAADLALKAPALQRVYDWTGFYVGGHFGYGSGSLGPGTNPVPEESGIFPSSVTGLIGGIAAFLDQRDRGVKDLLARVLRLLRLPSQRDYDVRHSAMLQSRSRTVSCLRANAAYGR